MSRREDIETSFWSDPDVLELSGIARAVYVWSFTNQRCGMAGVYKVAKVAMQLETGWSMEQLDEALRELEEARYLFYDGRVMWVRSRVKLLRTKSPSIAKAIRNDLDAVGDHPSVDAFREEYGGVEWLWRDAPQTPREPHATPSTPPRDPQETPNGGQSDPLVGSQGKGTGKGKGNRGGGAGGGDKSAAVEKAEAEGFAEWLLDHSVTTGRTAPAAGTKAYAALASAFNACRSEGHDLGALKLATRAAHASDFRRANGYDKAESVLRVTKVHDLIEDGRRAGRGVDRQADLTAKLVGS